MGSSRLFSALPGIAGRVRRFFLMELSGSDSPLPGRPGLRVFRAWRYWERDVRGLPFFATAISAFFLVLGGILIGLTEALPWVSVLLILTGVAVPLALLPGKVAALYPYAAEIEGGAGVRFYTPLGKVHIPVDELKRVRWSWVYGGWVVNFKNRYGLLSAFIIHVAWGRQGRELARAIEEELIRRA